ncbi:hypothetical protein K7432_002606 [Basidiobolus ranarum]|uniref:F-box domain-containing protein n=1 Tax=Basidiobolus ranarum TaxID=34480 RepID=A0ABR2W7J4_9FUNG
MSKPDLFERRKMKSVSKPTTKDDFELDKNSLGESSQNNSSKHIIPTPPSSPLVLTSSRAGPSSVLCLQQQPFISSAITIQAPETNEKVTDLVSIRSGSYSPTVHSSSESEPYVHNFKSPECQHFAPELLYKIFSYLSFTQASLGACALVCKQWNSIACTILWRRPIFTSLSSVEKFISALNIDLTLQPDLSSLPPPCLTPSSSNISSSPIASTSSFTVSSTSEYGGLTPSDHTPCSDMNSHNNHSEIAAQRYASLVRIIDFTLLDEIHRNSTVLSHHIVRLIPLVQPSLQCLDLGFNKGVKNFDLQRLSPWLSNLTSLNLAGGGRTDIVLTKLSKHCPNLTRLSVSWNSQLTDFGFVEMARHCRKLRALDLTNCAQITDTGVMALAVYCTQLRVLSVSYCQCVGEVAIWELVRSCKELKLINALGCINLSRRFPDELKVKYPELLINVPGVLPFYYPEIA